MSAIRFSRLGARIWPLALVLFCGLMLGYFLSRTYVAPLPRQYQLNFDSAKWIEPPAFSPIAYFRQKIFLSTAPEQAWIQVAATDAYVLTINGKKVDEESFLQTRVSGIYDIKTQLMVGTNVIAVEINRLSYPGSAQLLVSGAIKQPGHAPVPFVSDESWRVTPDTGIVQGTEPWNSPLVQDETWPRASVVKNNTSQTINWVSTQPKLLQLPPAGKWLLAQNAPREAIFATTLEAKRSGQETWIQIASSGDLDLLVNDKLITSVPTPPLKANPLPRLVQATVLPPKNAEQEPSSDVSTATTSSLEPLSMDAYDISRWIHKGQNRIVAAVRSAQQPASFIAEGFTIAKNGTLQRFQTDPSWRVLRLSSDTPQGQSPHAIEAGENGSAPYGYLREGFVKQPRLTDFDTVAKVCARLLGTVLIVVLVWLLASWSAAVLRQTDIRTTLARDALFHVPISIGMLLALLLSYDYRFPNDWAFHPIICFGAILALAAIRLLHLVRVPPRSHEGILARIDAFPRFRAALPYIGLAVIMIFGWALRYHDISYISFDHDEMGLVQKSKGVLIRGYPYYEYAGGVIRPTTTYELVPYVLALFGKLFGYTEWSMRLPSCIWGTLTIGVVGLLGHRAFNWRVGLITAFTYACMTVDIRWAQNAFYVQQSQFFSMLTFWAFFEAIKFRPLNRRFVTLTAISFCLAFLSWEGNGFTLPALLLALIVVRWGEWWWLKDWHVYRCLFFVAALVIAQFCWRTLLGTPPYLAVGSGLSNIAGPSLFFLNYAYRPTYYIDKLLFDEGHVPFTLMILLGLPFCWRHVGFRYVVTVLGTLFFCYTNLLSAVSQRYSYFFQPLLLLGGIGATVMLYDRLLAIARVGDDSFVTRTVARASGCAIIFLLFIQSSEWLIKPYTLASEGNAPGLMSRMNTYRYDYRRAGQYVKEHFRPGDIVIPEIAHVFEYYSGMSGDYYINTLLAKKITYSDKLSEPVFIEKFRGNPAIRDLTELKDVIHRGRRTWIVFAPYSSLAKLAGPDVIDYVSQNGKAVFETYRAKVYLIEGATQPDLARTP